MVDAVVIIDVNGNTEYLNHSACRLIDVMPNAACGHSLNEIFTLLDIKTFMPIEKPIVWLRRHFTKNSGSNLVQIQKHDRNNISVDISISPICLINNILTGMMLVIRDVSNYESSLNRLIEIEHYDEKSQILHRAELEHRLAHVAQSNAETNQHALLFLDLEHFKEINDTAGHTAGDQILREISELFRAQLRERDTLALIDGDKFGLLLEHCPLPSAIERAQAIRRAATQNVFEINDQAFILDISIGIAAFHGGKHISREVFRIADAACYIAKRNITDGDKICSSVMD